jgi:HSP20 family protein
MVKNNETVSREQLRPVQRRVAYTPQVDILEFPDELVLDIDMPGVKPDKVEIRFERGELTVHGQREGSCCQAKALVEEFEGRDYYRAFLISQDVDPDKISADLKNGVLRIRLPKAATAQPRRISVQGS